MKVLLDGRFEYQDMPYNFYDFKKFEDDSKNLLYTYGIFGLDVPLEYKNRIYFNIEEPNGLYHSGKLLHERELNGKLISNDWTKIYQLCPYSTRWSRDVLGDKRYDFVPNVPMMDEKYYPNANQEKIYDLFYQGSVHGWQRRFSECIDVITNYSHVWTSLSDEPDPRKTHIKVPFLDKLNLECQCKITITDNLLYDPTMGAFVNNISKLPKWNENEAFSHITEGIIPQFKVKIYESMLCKVLVLAQKTPWNTMEEFGLIEGEHFLYFEDSYQLKDMINECLNNWDYCQTIVENAYNKTISENSLSAIYNKYLKPYDA